MNKDIIMNLFNIFFRIRLIAFFTMLLSVLLLFSLDSSYCNDCTKIEDFIGQIRSINYEKSFSHYSLTETNRAFNNNSITWEKSLPIFMNEWNNLKCDNKNAIEECWRFNNKAKELGEVLAEKCNKNPDPLTFIFYLNILENIYFHHLLPCKQKSAMILIYYYFLNNLDPKNVLKFLSKDDIQEIEKIKFEYKKYIEIIEKCKEFDKCFDELVQKYKESNLNHKEQNLPKKEIAKAFYINYELLYYNLSKIQKHLLTNLYEEKNILLKQAEAQKEVKFSEPKEEEREEERNEQTVPIHTKDYTSPSESNQLTEVIRDENAFIDFLTSIFKGINNNDIFSVLFSFIMLTILAFLLRVNYINKQMIKKFDTINKNINRDPFSNKLDVLTKDIKLLKDTDKYSSSIQTITKSLDDLHSLFQQSISEIKRLIKSFQSIYKKQSEKKSKSEDVVDTIYAQEKDILSESWDKFYQKHEQNTKIANEIAMSETYVFFKEVTTNLEKQLSSNKTLEENFTKALTGLKDSIKFVLRMAHFSDKKNIIKHTKTKNEQNIRQMREITSRLNYYKEQDFNISDAFKPLIWVRERFLDFADSFYHEYQKQLLKNEHQALTEAKSSVTEILQKANIKIIEIELGATQFDSKIHIARSTETNISYPNNVIMRVIRNGFSYISNGKFIQQPEVIVNKR